MPTASNAIDTLNGLIDEVRCSIELYGDARSQPAISTQSSLSLVLGHLETVVVMLAAEVNRLGGRPLDRLRPSDANQSFARYDRRMIAEGHHPLLEHIEQQERHLETRIEGALNDPSLPSVTIDVLNKVYSSVRSDCQITHALNRGHPFGLGIPGLV